MACARVVAGSRLLAAALAVLMMSLLSVTPPPMAAVAVSRGYIGRRVGGRTRIEDVGSNEEVQELGRFSVAEYNHMRGSGSGGHGTSKELVFSEVVEAEQQVVAGIKYYLKLEAFRSGDKDKEVFESVVVVKPWDKSKALLNFGPFHRSTSTTSMIMTQGF